MRSFKSFWHFLVYGAGEKMPRQKRIFLGVNFFLIGLSFGFIVGSSKATLIITIASIVTCISLMMIIYAIHSAFEDRFYMEVENLQKKAELNQARKLQLSLLPESPPNHRGYRWKTCCPIPC